MTSTPEFLRFVVVASALLTLTPGCGLERPADPPAFDCAAIDRAAERFPDECGEPVDAGPDEDAGDPVGDTGMPTEDAGASDAL